MPLWLLRERRKQTMNNVGILRRRTKQGGVSLRDYDTVTYIPEYAGVFISTKVQTGKKLDRKEAKNRPIH
jgi:hypothetical protein